MFAIRRSTNTDESTEEHKCIPNILPCKIHHDGPVDISTRYWNPEVDATGQTAYFRGRKLRGRKVTVPEGYEGVVTIRTERTLPKEKSGVMGSENNGHGGQGEYIDLEGAVKVLEQKATFDEFMVWGHEQLPPASDCYVKGVEEWIQFAEAVNSLFTSSLNFEFQN